MSIATSKPRLGVTVWLTGLPASGKTTIARVVADRLHSRGRQVELLDSDEVRRVLTPHPTYTPAERDHFYAMLLYLARLLVRHGVDVLIAATAPQRRYRDEARAALPHFVEVYVNTDLETCRMRDPKGLYARADAGQITALPGVGRPYEPPLAAEVTITADLNPEQAADAIVAAITPIK